MNEKSHTKTESNSSNYKNVKYQSECSTTVYAAKAVRSTESDPQQIVTWKSIKSKSFAHDAKASFKLNLCKIENEENNRRMNNLLRGRKEAQIITKNIE